MCFSCPIRENVEEQNVWRHRSIKRQIIITEWYYLVSNYPLRSLKIFVLPLTFLAYFFKAIYFSLCGSTSFSSAKYLNIKLLIIIWKVRNMTITINSFLYINIQRFFEKLNYSICYWNLLNKIIKSKKYKIIISLV